MLYHTERKLGLPAMYDDEIPQTASRISYHDVKPI